MSWCQKKEKEKEKRTLPFLHLLQHGWKFWQEGRRVQVPICRKPRGGWRMWCSAARRWSPLADHAEQWQQPQHTRKNISRCSPRRITNPPPTQAHVYGPHMGYISWRPGLKVPISPRVHIYSPTLHVPRALPELNPYVLLAVTLGSRRTIKRPV